MSDRGTLTEAQRAATARVLDENGGFRGTGARACDGAMWRLDSCLLSAVLALAVACSSGGSGDQGDGGADAGARPGDAHLGDSGPDGDGGRDAGPPLPPDAEILHDAEAPSPEEAGPPVPTDGAPPDAADPPPGDAASAPPDGSAPPPPDAGDDPEPPPARANLVVFNRGLELEQIIDRITVQPGSELWTVDPDRPRSERRIVPADGGAHLMPSWSGDKGRIVFASTRGAPAGGPAYLNLWTVAHDGADPRRLTETDAHDWTPAWSPDGRWVAFGSTRGKRDRASVWGLDVWLVEVGTGATRVLYAGPGQDEDPVFSRDSRTVYFNTAQEGDGCLYQIWQVPVDGGTERATPVRDARGAVLCGEDPSVSPDGGSLLVVTHGRLRRHDLATGRVVERDGAEEPWIAPDGRRFVHIVDLRYIHVGDLERGDDRRVTMTGPDFFPRWTP